MLPPSFPPSRRRHHGNGSVPLRAGAGVALPNAALPAGNGRAPAATGAPQSCTGTEAGPRQGALAGMRRLWAAVRSGRGRGEMVAPGFLPVPQLLPGSHHGGLRSSAGRPYPPLPALARQPPASPPAPAPSTLGPVSAKWRQPPRGAAGGGAGFMFRVAEPTPTRAQAARKSW